MSWGRGRELQAGGGRQHTARSRGMSPPLTSRSGPEDAWKGAGRNKAGMQEANARVANRWHTRQQLPGPGQTCTAPAALTELQDPSQHWLREPVTKGQGSPLRWTLSASTPIHREGSTGA